MDDEPAEEVVTGWSGVWVTALVTGIQGSLFYWFFAYQRRKESTKSEQTKYNLYEPRQHTRRHRSPAPFEESWWRAAWAVTDEETLRCIGLDSYMFLRLFRLGARMTALGTALSIILIPVYATGEARGDATEKFNLLTLARVEADSPRIWAALIAWWIFVAFILRDFWMEWKLYALNRYAFLAHGDVDMPKDYRYAVKVEQVPEGMRSDDALHSYFERLFPSKVQQATAFLQTGNLQKLLDERKDTICKLESAVAFTEANPVKPRPIVKVDAKMGCCGGTKVDAIEHYQQETERLNKDIDGQRTIYMNDAGTEKGGYVKPTTVAFVTFTSLRAKQAAIQCELTGNPDSMVVSAASDPKAIVWKNITVPLPVQKLAQLQSGVIFTVGILFWALPVSFVTSIANLNSILEAIGLDQADPSVFWYGLVSGLLPVIALAILMAVLYMTIVSVATSFVRFKSMADIDSYSLYWHQLYQFANLWLILIGGSAFNQIDALINDISSIVDIVATALPGASVFFVNMILVSSFGAFGLELSMLPTYGVKLIMAVIQPEAMQTQRQLDDAKTPPSIVWGQQIPPVVFIFLVSVLYCTIVPIIQVFALAYFAGSYIVWKHQCLHIYAQPFEGGGDATWQQLFAFLMACLYMGEFVFIAYMGIKEAPVQAILGFFPLGATIVMHQVLSRNIIKPLKNLSLEVAAHVDIDEGELSSEAGVGRLYAMPALDLANEERGPMPYRRDLPEAQRDQKEIPTETEEGAPDQHGFEV
jgi:hypothetical protein